ncbi:hypothetical protein [Luteolibacter sp. AS25]|uniref:hypothetical protein n=1 Tax=Luteolibacter sp. AS25 TaxID=3135776 RepID=UPI00398A60AA
MKKLILHIGFHKTGSTTLQSFFAKNENELRRRGLWIANAGRENKAHLIHSHLFWDLVESDLFDSKKGGLNECKDELNHLPNRAKLMISTEGFSRLKKPKDLLSLFDEAEIQVIAFRRKKSSLASSLYIESLKAGSNSTFIEFLDKESFLLDHDHICDLWRKENIDFIDFDIGDFSSNKALVTTFLNSIGIDHDGFTFNEKRLNTSVSESEAFALFLANNLLRHSNLRLPTSEKLRFLSKIRSSHTDLARDQRRFDLTELEAAALNTKLSNPFTPEKLRSSRELDSLRYIKYVTLMSARHLDVTPGERMLRILREKARTFTNQSL